MGPVHLCANCCDQEEWSIPIGYPVVDQCNLDLTEHVPEKRKVSVTKRSSTRRGTDDE